MGDVVRVRAFEPRIPRDPDTEMRINADLYLIEQAAAKLITMRTQIIRESRPLDPFNRIRVIEAGDALEC